MAYKATRNTFGKALAPDALGGMVEQRVQIMAGDDFPPGVEPADKGAVEEFSPTPYAGPAYPPESITLDDRIKERRERGQKPPASSPQADPKDKPAPGDSSQKPPRTSPAHGERK